MSETIRFLLRHGYSVVFVWVFAEQVGLPIPSAPILLGAGALAGQHHLSLAEALTLAVLASLASDLIWYELGRRRGHAVLNLICRISLEPDSCVRRTEDLFTRNGARSLLFAKFVPGLGTVAPPLAGLFRMRPSRFILWDVGGSLAWAGAFLGTGYIFSSQLERVAQYSLRLGSGLVVLLVAGLAGYLTRKYIQRRRFLRSLRIARITPEELKQKLEAGEPLVVVDLRNSTEFDAADGKLPGALHLDPREIEQHHDEIPRDRDVVLYCT
ncbi:MAG TPA: VTT domain-containing protein [Terriglobia bacterium]|nr:VTT domain-containing protein [Terriglobia bacterium]